MDGFRILVANRGEIARRVIRSAHALGHDTVAVHSDADADAAHVEEAGAAVAIGPAAARESYLRTDAILAAARESGADAIHPGYGFLAENAAFAEAVIDAGLVWIGARPETIRAMGDKDRARRIACDAGVPVVPGSDRLVPGEAYNLDAAAKATGYPLLVKASAGGGGIGMRRVDGPELLEKTVAATQSMAEKSFGDGTVFLERFVPRARHVEIQVFGLGDGRAVHFYERDCSLQRRFQKVIEESPAPGLSAELRARMAAAAVALCEETRYTGAGTVEFILDVETQEFFFLEMNTRIQVEHPVTEMVTGYDLVALQIDLARGQLENLDQSQISLDGHAVECRLYAERPEKMFMPAPGTLSRFRLPNTNDTMRIEAAYREGETISTHYDPMIAKIIAHGPDRATACDRAAAALRAIEIEGPGHNRDFLIACLEHDAFRAGAVHTGFIDVHRDALVEAATQGETT